MGISESDRDVLRVGMAGRVTGKIIVVLSYGFRVCSARVCGGSDRAEQARQVWRGVKRGGEGWEGTRRDGKERRGEERGCNGWRGVERVGGEWEKSRCGV